VLKGGDVVVEEGEVRAVSEGREFVFRPAYDETIEEYLRPLFQKVYTMSFENYPSEIERLHNPDVIACEPMPGTVRPLPPLPAPPPAAAPGHKK
jgi:formylmethanofuran dehydrogenase subunit A